MLKVQRLVSEVGNKLTSEMSAFKSPRYCTIASISQHWYKNTGDFYNEYHVFEYHKYYMFGHIYTKVYNYICTHYLNVARVRLIIVCYLINSNSQQLMYNSLVVSTTVNA